MGWEVVPQEGRLDLDTGGPFEPAWVMCDGDEVYGVELSLVPAVDIDDPDDYDRIEDVETEMFELFEEASRTVEAAIGRPVFNDGRANPRFPEDDDGSEWLAFWRTPSARLSVKQLHEDAELPYRLSFVVEPHEQVDLAPHWTTPPLLVWLALARERHGCSMAARLSGILIASAAAYSPNTAAHHSLLIGSSALQSWTGADGSPAICRS